MAMMATATRLSAFCLQFWHSRPAVNVGVDTSEGDCATASLKRRQADRRHSSLGRCYSLLQFWATQDRHWTE
jgi:hypothetical protein